MKNSAKYLLTGLCYFALGTFLYAQGTTTAEAYQYQRDQAFKNYMENISSKGMAGPANTNFDYSIDQKAVQNMVDHWEKMSGRKTAAENDAERAALRQKWATEYQASVAYDAFDDNRRLIYQNMRNFYADIYKSVGFPVPEANMLANKQIMEKRTTYNDSYGVLVFVDNPAVDLAFSAKKTFEELKQIASFEELVPLIYDFSFTGYSAIKALEYLETRFPDKKAIINTLKPLYGMSYWQYIDVDFEAPSTTRPGKSDYYFSCSSYNRGEGTELYPEMADYVYKWMEENPEGLVSLFESGNKYGGNFEIIQHAFNKKQWQQYARFIVNFAMHGTSNLAEKGKIMEDYRQYGVFILDTKEERGDYEKSKHFTLQDFEAVRNRYQISGVKAMELLGLVGSRYSTELYTQFGPKFPWIDALYAEEVKQYADSGDKDAQFLYAVHQMQVNKKNEWKQAYDIIKKFMEEGYNEAFNLDRYYGWEDQLNFSKKYAKEYKELKKAHNR
ncbi:MAG: hypothetical protein M0Q90_16995 [Bacteroidales bacterium]|nr:hypothetical protein [Bacteroidales bacterium]